MGLNVTRFEDVEELIKDTSLKNILWETKFQYEQVMQQWEEFLLETLDANDMQEEFREYQKNISKVSKCLQGNIVALDLKASIADYAILLLIVSDLKNPALKQKFQEQISQLLNFNIFGEEAVKFGKLFELRAFHFADQFAAISAQATNEQNLHEMLNTVSKMMDKLYFSMQLAKGEKKTLFFRRF
jgi:hypothetical protein